jgi:hypothetical protein
MPSGDPFSIASMAFAPAQVIWSVVIGVRQRLSKRTSGSRLHKTSKRQQQRQIDACSRFAATHPPPTTLHAQPNPVASSVPLPPGNCTSGEPESDSRVSQQQRTIFRMAGKSDAAIPWEPMISISLPAPQTFVVSTFSAAFCGKRNRWC